MTTEEPMIHLRGNTPIAQVVAVFVGEAGRIAQAGQQRVAITALEGYAMSLEAVDRILTKAVEVRLVNRITDQSFLDVDKTGGDNG